MTTHETGLHTSAFLLRIRPGMADEYRRRHAAVWPELLAALREAGVVHYEIYLDAIGLRALGCMWRDRVPDPAEPEHPAILRWRAHMADVLEMDGERPLREPIECVFRMTA